MGEVEAVRASNGSEAAALPKLGKVLAGRYRLKGHIAVGGMAAVYSAHDSFLDQTVAVKILRTDVWKIESERARKLLSDLRIEAKASLKLAHPNIVRTLTYDRDDGFEFLVMEFVDGEDLRTYQKSLPGRSLPPRQIVAVGVQALKALEVAHRHRILHLDVKPANLLLQKDGVIKLCDFGLSAATAFVGRGKDGPIFVGTAPYVSPEMIQQKQVDSRADLYSLAATLYDLATGQPPYGRDPRNALYGHVKGEIESPTDVPDELADVLRRGLSKDPSVRFQTATAMRRALQACLADQPVTTGSVPAVPRASSSPAAAPVARVSATPSVPSAPPASSRTNGKESSSVTPPSRMVVRRVSYSLESGTWSGALPELDSDQTLVLAFGSPSVKGDRRAFEELARKYPRSHVLGCSTSGEVHGDEIRDDSVSVAVCRFARTRLSTSAVSVRESRQSFAAGQALARKLKQDDLKAVFVLSEGLNVNGSELVRGFNAVLGTGIPVTGGLAGDGSDFNETWVALGSRVESGLVAAVGLYGTDVVVGHGSQGGWDRFGPERVVTRSEGNVLFELDGRSALELYKEYLGDQASGLPATGLLFPLALQSPNAPNREVVRTLLSVDESAGSMTFAGDLPEGHRVQLMKANFDRLVSGASGAAASANGRVVPEGAKGDLLAVAVSCVGRRLVLKDRTEDEVEAVLESLPSSTSLVGFYSYGELSPHSDGTCGLHNQTMTLTVFAERDPVIERPVSNGAGTHPPKAVPPVPVRPSLAAVETQTEGPVVRRVSYSLESGTWSGALPELDSDQTLVLAFGSPSVKGDRRAFEELARKYPRSHVLGCSTSGEVHGDEIRDDSVSVAVCRFARTRLSTSAVSVRESRQSFAAGQALARKLKQDDLKAVFVLSEGLNVNGSELVRGFNAVLGTGIPVTGGLAGDGSDFNETWVALGSRVESGLVAAVGLYGTDVVVGHGSQGGWDRFGPERVVTRSEGNVLFELDGRSALELYKEYLGDQASGLPATGLLFPLALQSPNAPNREVVRTLLSVDESAGSMTFAGDLPEGHRVQLMKANFDRLVSGASGAAASANGRVVPEGAKGDLLAVAVSCVGRRLVLKDRTEDEVEAVLESLPPSTSLVGFYSYGELSPHSDGTCGLHNQTMTLTVFGEKPPVVKTKAKPPSVRPPAPPSVSTAPRSAAPSSVPPAVPVRDPNLPTKAPPARALAPVAPRTPDDSVALGRPRAPTGSFALSEAPLGLPHHQGIDVQTETIGDVAVLRFAGRLTEGFEGRKLGRMLTGRVLFDLAGVQRVTSFGVREWLQLVQEAETRGAELYFSRCSEAVVNQLNMIHSFAGRATVVSVQAPYACNSCGRAFAAEIDLGESKDLLSARQEPPQTCARCQSTETNLDDDVDAYFAFVGNQLGKPVPHEIRRLCSDASTVEVGSSHSPLEMDLEGSTTKLTIHADIDTRLRWNRLLDGLEGDVVVDLGEVQEVVEPGARAFLGALLQASEAQSIELRAAPPMLAKEAARRNDRRVRVETVQLFVDCGNCSARNREVVDVFAEAKLLKVGELPHPSCRRCGHTLDLSPHSDVLRLMAQRVDREPSQAHAVVPASEIPIATSAEQRSGRSNLATALAAGALVLGAIALTVVLTRNAPTPVVEVTTPSAPAAAVQEPSNSTTVDGPATALLPPWTDQPLLVDESTVSVVGHARSLDGTQAALDRARDRATTRLVHHLFTRLAGSEYHSRFLSDRVTWTPDQADDSLIAAVAHRFETLHGANHRFERRDVHTRSIEGGEEVYARFEMSRQSVDELEAMYRRTERLRGAGVAQYFPGLATRVLTDASLVVYDVPPRVPAAVAGLRVGDGVRAIAGQRVTDLDALSATMREAWVATRPGRAVEATVESQGTESTVRFRRLLRAQ